MSNLHIYGHGKLLITSEYFVLDGALALVIPVKFGQHFRLKHLAGNNDLLYWISLNVKKQVWMNTVLDLSDFSIIGDNTESAQRLKMVLSAARQMNPAFLRVESDVAVETALEFPNEWGLGSSSTFIYAVAKWAGVDGYELLKKTLGGSGYDVACADAEAAILYQLKDSEPTVTPVKWRPVFAEQLYFTYLGKKKLSNEAILFYREKLKHKAKAVQLLSNLTTQVLGCSSLDNFEIIVNEHENVIASELQLKKVKDECFNDFSGSVKSLGAWGGDFVLMTYTRGKDELSQYLKTKGLDTVFSWDEMMLP